MGLESANLMRIARALSGNCMRHNSPLTWLGDADCLTAMPIAVQEPDARHIFQQLILLVDYLHRMCVARRNVKLESIALEGDRRRPVARLMDLGPAVLPHASLKADGLEPRSHVGYTGASASLPASSCSRVTPSLTISLAMSCSANHKSVPAAVHEPAEHILVFDSADPPVACQAD